MKIRFTIALLITLIVFQTSIGFSQNRIIKNPNYTQEDFTLTMPDGVVLDCSKFYPDNTPPVNGWPAIIYCHGFGLSKADLESDAIDQTGYGYYCLTYSMRGQGFSTGKTNLISTSEMNDFIQIVNYVKNDNLVNPDRVGANGASQGGIIPFMAVCNGTNLRMIAPEISSPEFSSSWIENKCVKMTLLWSVSYDTSICRYNNQVARYRNWILSDTPDKWDSLAYYLPINRDFASKVSQNTVPVFISNVWQDKFFNVFGVIKQIQNLNVPKKFYFGTYPGHGADENLTEQAYYANTLLHFYDYWLKDVQNGIMDSSTYVYASSSYPRIGSYWSWTRSYSDSWSPAGVEDIKFYFTPDLKLINSVSTLTPDTLGFLNDVKNQSLTMTDAVNSQFTGTLFYSKFGKTQLIFETLPLVQNTKMVGTPMVNVHYRSDANKSQFNFQIWEVLPNSVANLVSRSNATERNITPNVIRQLTFYGTSHSHIFKSGSKIRVILTNLDNISNDFFLRTNPYVLPSLLRARNTIYMNPANPTYIQLPLIGYISNDIVSNTSVVPGNYFLEQNYPNPFNPSTRIKFGIPTGIKSQNVQIFIYDISGRQVIKLVDERLNPGEYEVKWDALNMPSGTYFCKLISGNYSEAKKIVLIK